MSTDKPEQNSWILILVAILTGGLGFLTGNATADKQLSGELVSAAVEVLKELPDEELATDWARQVISNHSGVPLDPEAARQFGELPGGQPSVRPRPGESTRRIALLEGSPIGWPQLGIKEMSVQLQERQGLAIARIALSFLGGAEDVFTVVEGEASEGTIQDEWGRYRLRVDAFVLEHRLILLRFEALADAEDEAGETEGRDTPDADSGP